MSIGVKSAIVAEVRVRYKYILCCLISPGFEKYKCVMGNKGCPMDMLMKKLIIFFTLEGVVPCEIDDSSSSWYGDKVLFTAHLHTNHRSLSNER